MMETTSTQSQVVDRGTEGGDHVLDFYPFVRRNCQKSDIEELEVGQGLALGESFENDEFFLQRVHWV